MSKELEERLAAAKAKTADIAARALEREKATELDRKVALAEREAADAEAIEKAVLEHGALDDKVRKVDTNMGVIVLKRPNPLLWKKFRDSGAKSKDLEAFVRSCLVHPNVTRFEEIVEEYPATLEHCGDAVTALAGFRAQDVLGK